MPRTVARVIVDALSELGVSQVSGGVGDPLNPLTEAIRLTEDVEWVGHSQSPSYETHLTRCHHLPHAGGPQWSSWSRNRPGCPEFGTELEESVRRAVGAPGPVLLDVLTNPDEIAAPAKPTVRQGWGTPSPR